MVSFILLPIIVQAGLQDQLVQFERSLRVLTSTLEQIKPSEPIKPLELVKPVEKSLKELENSLLDTIGVYKKNPVNFTQKITRREFNTLKDNIIAYFKKAVDKAESDDEPIDIAPEIKKFVRILLGQKEVKKYNRLIQNINEKQFKDVKKYAKNYIIAISQKDIIKSLQDIAKEVDLLVAQIPGLTKKNIVELGPIYTQMQEALKKMEMFMLPTTTGNAARLKAKINKLHKRFETVMNRDQKFLADKYAQLNKDSTLKQIKATFEREKPGKRDDVIDKLKTSRDIKIRERMRMLVYQVPDEEFKRMVLACQDIKVVTQATSEDKEPLTIKEAVETLCDEVNKIRQVQTYTKKLTTWFDTLTVAGYSKETAQSAYENVVHIHKRIQGNFKVIPEDLEGKITQAKKVLLDRLVAFTSEYEVAIISKGSLIIAAKGAKKLQPATIDDVNEAALNCVIIKAIYKHQDEPIPKKVKDLCKIVQKVLLKVNIN